MSRRSTLSRFMLAAASLFVLLGCVMISTPIVTPTPLGEIPKTGSEPVLSKVDDMVEQGPNEAMLTPVDREQILKNNDIVKVSKGGEGRIEFGDYFQVRIFNNSKLQVEHGENLSPIARVRLEMGGFIGKVFKTPDGKDALEVVTPDGVKVTIHGTEFFVVYQPEEWAVGVGNFGGTISVTTEGTTQPVSPQHYVIIRPGHLPEPERPIPLPQAEIEQSFSNTSPVEVLEQVLEPTGTPDPTQTNTSMTTAVDTPGPTATPTITLTPTLACPPALQTNQIANCREGPGTGWNIKTYFPSSTKLVPDGLAYWANELWFRAAIPKSGQSCWIASYTVSVAGETTCLPVMSVPPTYTPVTTPTPPQLLAAPQVISPENGLTISFFSTWEKVVSLAWFRISDADSYEWMLEDLATGMVYKGSIPGDLVYDNIYDRTSVRVSVEATTPPKQYRWRLRAIDKQGNPGLYTEYRSFSSYAILDAPAPAAPSGDETVACDGPKDSITLQWAAVSGADQYEWMLGDTRGRTGNTSATVTISCGSPPSSYSWSVAAIDTLGKVGLYSQPRRFYANWEPPTQTPEPSPPTLLAPANNITFTCAPGRNTYEVTFQWTPVSSAVYYDLHDSFWYRTRTNNISATLTFECGNPPNVYYWGVTAYTTPGSPGYSTGQWNFSMQLP